MREAAIGIICRLMMWHASDDTWRAFLDGMYRTHPELAIQLRAIRPTKANLRVVS